jgi:hypothetical protein
MRDQKDSKDTNARREYQVAEAYVKNLAIYIKDGIYLDHKYGANREGTMNIISIVNAYNPDGSVKRTLGMFYPDLDEVWTEELAAEYN